MPMCNQRDDSYDIKHGLIKVDANEPVVKFLIFLFVIHCIRDHLQGLQSS